VFLDFLFEGFPSGQADLWCAAVRSGAQKNVPMIRSDPDFFGGHLELLTIFHLQPPEFSQEPEPDFSTST